MNRCPITYEFCGSHRYSAKGLKLLSRNLKGLQDFPYTPKQQIQMASEMAAKLSIQGVQPKLSVKLNTTKQVFEVVESGGRFILKSPHQTYDELPENEDLTMKLASIIGIEIPFHGMVYNIDGSLSYFIQRFDRLPKNKKVATEDFSQLLGFSRDTKYESSMEKVIAVLEKHCTFPKIEKLKLFRLSVFNFLIGNEDMHLKNFTLIRRDNLVELSPSYDLLNTTIVLSAKEEIALPIKGKKSRLTREDLLDYFGCQRLGINSSTIEKEMQKIKRALPIWNQTIEQSFLSLKMKKLYLDLLQSRLERIGLTAANPTNSL